MNIIFMGTPEIAATCLKKMLNANLSVTAVYTKPDTPKNRGMKLAMSPVKELALEHGIPVYQPLSFKDDAVYDEMLALKPDLVVTVAYGKILPQRFLDIPQHGCINMHASILPKLRGAGPVQWAILNHETETGVTAMYMSAGMDEGDIIEIRRTPIDPMETSDELMARLALIAADLAVDTVQNIQNGTVTRTPQDASLATYAPMLSRELSPIDWTQCARFITDQVRGLQPWPCATAVLGGTAFKIFRVETEEKKTDKTPGTILALTKKGLEVACGDGEVVTVTQLQAEGKKRMPAVDYFRGHPISL
ncbi:MAG: methionyl-tRNA formyltransferase [Oscillospiraceae bacterium]|nr:methionyl-tRNA formyltransferase [Oscillospiraceae bacterium]